MRNVIHKPHRLLPTLAALAAATLAVAAPEAGAQGMSPQVLSMSGKKYRGDKIIVRFAPGAAPTQRGQARSENGVDADVQYSLVQGLERVSVRPGRTIEETVAALRKNPNVLYAEPDYVVSKGALPNDPSYGSLWGMSNIKAPTAWDITKGTATMVVAVVDSGIDRKHPDLVNNMWTNPGETANGLDDDGNGYIDDLYGWDFANNDNDPTDVAGHGTHVAGTIGAQGNNALGVAGVNWQIKLVALKFLADDGTGSTSSAIAALEYANKMGFRVSNNSWGGGGYSQALYDTIAALRAKGHLFIAAAGNSGLNNDTTPTYPASYNLDNIIAVASINSADGRSSFSNYGATSVDLGAPGENILSTYKGSYGNLSGTSMAAPHVAGAAAMIMGLRPTWSYAQVRDSILRTARVITALKGLTVTGGTLDLAAALAWSPPLPPAAPSGLTATVASSAQVNLAWTDNSTNETGFKVERSTDGLNFTQIAMTAAGVRTFSATGLAGGTSYTFRVRAYNAGGDSAYTNTVVAVTPLIPPAPTLSGAASLKLATLTWTNVNGETGYRLRRAVYSTSKKLCGTYSLVATLGADVTRTTNAVSTSGSYCYRVEAFSSAGTSPLSNVVTLVL